MEEFAESSNSLRTSLPFIEMDQNMELMSHFSDLSGIVMENPSFELLGFSGDSYFSQQPSFALPFSDNLLGLPPVECPRQAPGAQIVSSVGEETSGDKRRKIVAESETSSGNTSGPLWERVVTEEKNKKRNTSGSGKRGRGNSKELEKPKEVVHVRARRGQATDSHSLAERVRREKINERMRCLQDLVPGCYKTMGMAGMLDEIINYVQSLQNQVEFLSMKLSAASTFYDFNTDNEILATPQGSNVYGTQEVEKLVREAYGGALTSTQQFPSETLAPWIIHVTDQKHML